MFGLGPACGCTGAGGLDPDTDSDTSPDSDIDSEVDTDVEWDTEVNTGPDCDPATSVPGGCLDVAPGPVSGPPCGGDYSDRCFTIDVSFGGDMWVGCVTPYQYEDGLGLLTDAVIDSHMQTAACVDEELVAVSRQTPYLVYSYVSGGEWGDRNFVETAIHEASSRATVGTIVASYDESPEPPCDFNYRGAPTAAPLAITAALVIVSRFGECTDQGDDCDLCSCVTNGVTDAAPAGCEVD